ncbi:hypothetical protein TRIUR3_29797 [Triticum urartu]|uniref:Uncharacterized protein n=1 Tax=Triticum urartu TaxID=4572 RepID=M7YL47_TRIUA|nr:hypothetical protein TRIUR3_29797 [Triticum urartu]
MPLFLSATVEDVAGPARPSVLRPDNQDGKDVRRARLTLEGAPKAFFAAAEARGQLARWGGSTSRHRAGQPPGVRES